VLDDAPGEGAALEELVLGLVVVVDAGAGALLGDALEVEDLGVLLLDEELGGRLVHGFREQRAQGGGDDDRGEDGEDDVAAAQEDVDVVPQVGLGRGLGGVGLRFGRLRRRHHTSVGPLPLKLAPSSAVGLSSLRTLGL
jgi:hypothetical protein